MPFQERQVVVLSLFLQLKMIFPTSSPGILYSRTEDDTIQVIFDNNCIINKETEVHFTKMRTALMGLRKPRIDLWPTTAVAQNSQCATFTP
jgi:hypothetical protein